MRRERGKGGRERKEGEKERRERKKGGRETEEGRNDRMLYSGKYSFFSGRTNYCVFKRNSSVLV